MINTEYVVDINNLDFFYGDNDLRFQVLKSVNLKISAGEIVILTGPSGSGKTTLLTIIGGLRKASFGSVNVLGVDVVSSNEETLTNLRKDIGFIFQQHNLIKSLSAVENVMMSLELDGGSYNDDVRRDEAEKILTRVGLSDRINHMPSSLSGGQKQRVSIARALVGNPKLILADEPTASLDKKTGHETVALLSEIAKDKKVAILLVTHDSRILDVADKIVNFEDGKIIA